MTWKSPGNSSNLSVPSWCDQTSRSGSVDEVGQPTPQIAVVLAPLRAVDRLRPGGPVAESWPGHRSRPPRWPQDHEPKHAGLQDDVMPHDSTSPEGCLVRWSERPGCGFYSRESRCSQEVFSPAPPCPAPWSRIERAGLRFSTWSPWQRTRSTREARFLVGEGQDSTNREPLGLMARQAVDYGPCHDIAGVLPRATRGACLPLANRFSSARGDASRGRRACVASGNT